MFILPTLYNNNIYLIAKCNVVTRKFLSFDLNPFERERERESSLSFSRPAYVL